MGDSKHIVPTFCAEGTSTTCTKHLRELSNLHQTTAPNRELVSGWRIDAHSPRGLEAVRKSTSRASARNSSRRDREVQEPAQPEGLSAAWIVSLFCICRELLHLLGTAWHSQPRALCGNVDAFARRWRGSKPSRRRPGRARGVHRAARIARRFPLRAYSIVHHDRCRLEVAIAQHRHPLSSSLQVACSSPK